MSKDKESRTLVDIKNTGQEILKKYYYPKSKKYRTVKEVIKTTK